MKVLIIIGVMFAYMMIGIVLEILVLDDNSNKRSSIATELMWPILLIRGLIFTLFSLIIFITDKISKLFRK